MAKKPYQDSNYREQITADLAAGLPDSMDELLEVASHVIQEQHTAVLAGNEQIVIDAANRYEAVVWKLNGGTFFGCMGSDSAPGKVLERYCLAVPGTVPMWGQCGEFIIHVDGIRALVEFGVNGAGGVDYKHFSFHAVDLDRPFISETGYRSHYSKIPMGLTVDCAAVNIFRSYINTRSKKIAASYRDKLAQRDLPSWCTTLIPSPTRGALSIPAGFVLVDVVLPAQKAFIAKKWAREAEILANKALRDYAVPHQEKCGLVEHRARDLDNQGIKSIGLNAKEGGRGFYPGQRCELVKASNRLAARDLGKMVIIVKILKDSCTVIAHDDKPVSYRTNQRGNRVVDIDPSCIRSFYDFEQLRILGSKDKDQ